MAEQEDVSGGGEAGGFPTSDGAAASLAFGAAALNEKVAAQAEQYLQMQTRLLKLQTEHLHEQRELVLSRLRWGRFSDRFKALLQMMTAGVGIVIAAVIVWIAWQASQSNGLLVERFSVPPDLAARGLTGEVLADRVLDNLMRMQAQTRSQRPARSYTENWNERSIKLDIPETGVSLGEVQDFLRDELGSDIHVSGEVFHDGAGLVLSARAGAEGAVTVTGSEDDLDAAAQRLSEAVYQMTQPYRYASYLASHGRAGEALPIFRTLALSGPPQERPWGYFGWGSTAMEDDGVGALRLLRAALKLEPDNVLVLQYITSIEELNGMPEASLRDYRTMLSVVLRRGPMVAEQNAAALQNFAQAGIDSMTGDYRDAAKFPVLAADVARRQTGEHDIAAARATMASSLVTPLSEIPGSIAVDNAASRTRIALEAADWRGALTEAGAVTPVLKTDPGLGSYMPAIIDPLIAEAKARLGDFDGGEAEIAGTPAGCDVCLRTRAHIAQLRAQTARADYWFSRAVQQAPSIPFAYTDWGRALLARGQPDAAIVEFSLAHQRGPKFADPLELWGEALMAQNRSGLALGKFTEAAKDAPNWGRLHLKWGEALSYAGKPDEAKAQLAQAAALDLTAAERAELGSSTK